MPTPSNIKLTVTINGGSVITGPVSGGQEVAPDDVLQFGIQDSTGVSSFLYEIYSHPDEFTLPSGWILDTDGYTYYYSGATPPTVTIPTNTAIWGKVGVRLTANGGQRLNDKNQLVAASDLVDESLVVWWPHASGLRDTGFLESNQVDSIQQWVGDVRRNWRIMADIILAAGGEANTISSVGAGTSLVKGKTGVDLQVKSLTAGDLIEFTANTNDVEIGVDLDALQDILDEIDTGDPSAVLFPYTFKTSTTDSDPGTACFRLNNATISSVTSIYIDLVDGVGRTLTTYFDAVTSGGNLWIVKVGDPTIWAAYNINTWTTASGYRKFGLTYVAGPGGFAADDACRIGITRLREQNVGGDIFTFTYSTTTADADPGSSTFRLNNATLSSASMAYIDSVSTDAGDIDAYLLSVAQGTLTITKRSDPTVRHNYDITAVTDATGYVKFAVTYKAGSGTLSNGDVCRLAFVRHVTSDAEVSIPIFTVQWSSSTTPGDRGQYKMGANNVSPGATTRIDIDDDTVDAGAIASWLNSLCPGQNFSFVKKTDNVVRYTFRIDKVVDGSGYVQFDCDQIAGSNADFGDNLSDGDELWLKPEHFNLPAGSANTVFAGSGDGTENAFTTDPVIDTITANEYLLLKSYGTTVSAPSNHAALYYEDTTNLLALRYSGSPGHKHILSAYTSHSNSIVFEEKYVFTRNSGSGVYTFNTETYTSPFGLTHGTSDVVGIVGEAEIIRIRNTGGTNALGYVHKFWIRWLNSTTLTATVSSDLIFGATSNLTITNSSDNITFNIDPGSSNNSKYFIRLSGMVFVGALP